MLHCKSAVCHSVSVVSVGECGDDGRSVMCNVVQCVRSIPLLGLSHDATQDHTDTSAQKSAQVRQVCREVPRAAVGGALSGQLHRAAAGE